MTNKERDEILLELVKGVNNLQVTVNDIRAEMKNFVTKEEFESLTNLNKGKLWCPSNLIYKDKKEITVLKYYIKQVELSDIAFYDLVDKHFWFLNDTLNYYGIQKAFDVNGNFIGDYNE